MYSEIAEIGLSEKSLTVIAPEIPVMVPVVESVAVIVWGVLGVLSVALNVPTPLVNMALAGSVAWLSELLNLTVPI